MDKYLESRLVNSIKRGTIIFSNNSTKMQGVQVSGYANETYQNIDRIQSYGLSSNLVPVSGNGEGAEGVIFSPGASSSRALFLGGDDRRYRPVGGSAGDVSLYTFLDNPSATNSSAQHRISLDCSSGRAIHIRAANSNVADVSLSDSGTVVITASGAQTATVTVDQSGSITLTNSASTVTLSPSGSLTLSNGGCSMSLAPGGNATINASSIAMNGNMDVSGNINASGNLSVGGSSSGGTALSSSAVTTALGFTPYNGTTNPSGYLTAIPALTSSAVVAALGFTPISTPQVNSDWNASSGVAQILNKPTIPSAYTLPTASTTVLGGVIVDGTTITINGSGVISSISPVTVSSFNSRTGAVTLTSSDVTTVLGFTPYNSANPSAYISGNQTITLSGDISGSGTTAITLTLASTGVTAGTYNSGATQHIPMTFDAKGRLTATGTAVTITPAFSSITGTPTTLAGYGIALTSSNVTTALGFTPYNSANPSAYISGNQTITLSGDFTGSGTTAITGTLATVNSNTGSFGSTSVVPVITVNGKGLITAVTTATITPASISAVATSALGVSVATLVSGTIPLSQIPTTITNGLEYTGTWNASTNTPTLTAGTGTKGNMYKVSTAGTQSITGSSILWNIGDIVLFDGTNWDKIDGVASEVSTVAGRTGAVVLASTDISGLAQSATTDTTNASNISSGTLSSTRLATSGVTAGTYNNTATSVTPLTVDTYGRITATGTAVTITPAFSSITGTPTTLAGYGIALTSANVTTALGFTPYNATNPSAYISGNQTIAVTGDATGSGTTAIALTLASTGVTAGTYNSGATQHIPMTFDVKGRLTATGTAVTITPAFSSITGTPTTLAGYGIALTSSNVTTALGFTPYNSTNPSAYISGNQTITLSGDFTGSGTTAITGTLATVNSNVGSFGTSTTIPVITVNAKGLVTAISTTAAAATTGDISIPAGGTVSTLATVNSNVGSFGSASAIPVLTVNGKGLVTAVSTTSVAASNLTNGTTGSGAIVLATAPTLSGLTVSGTTALATATATTVATTDNSTNIATTAYVKAQGFGTGHMGTYTAVGGETTLTVTDVVPSSSPWLVVVFRNGVQQKPSVDYGSANTNVLTLSTSLNVGDSLWWLHTGGYVSGSTYVLPPATTTTLGGVIVGSGLSVALNGTISIAGTGHTGTYTAVGGETTLTVTDAVPSASPWFVEIHRNGVRQIPSVDYSSAGTTTLTLTTALNVGDKVWWLHTLS